MPLRATPTNKVVAPPIVLDWLFIAKYADGFEIRQDPEDTCHSRDDGTGSAFSDVLARGEPVGFGLYHADGRQSVWVDLVTGNFVVNGTPVCAHNQFFEPLQHKLKLVYFREVRVQQENKATVQEDKTIKLEPVGDLRHFVNRYFIGWETVVNGQNKQVTLAVG